jgi:hypothetical protein
VQQQAFKQYEIVPRPLTMTFLNLCAERRHGSTSILARTRSAPALRYIARLDLRWRGRPETIVSEHGMELTDDPAIRLR